MCCSHLRGRTKYELRIVRNSEPSNAVSPPDTLEQPRSMYSHQFPIPSLDRRDAGAKGGDVGSIPTFHGGNER